MNIADYVILAFLAFYFCRGWSKGLLRAVLGPIALIACFFYSYFYFQRTHHLAVSAIICIIGPIVLTVLVGSFFALFKKEGSKEEKNEEGGLSLRSRYLGALLSTIWISFLIIFSIIFFLRIPIKITGLGGLRETVMQSQSVGFLADIFGERMPFLKDDLEPVDIRISADHFSDLQKTAEFKKLMEDVRVRRLYEDPKTKGMIEKQDIMGLLNDPNVQEIMQDPNLIRQFLQINQKMIQINQNKSKGANHGNDIYENH